jgi:fused signal recognition particle receptor
LLFWDEHMTLAMARSIRESLARTRNSVFARVAEIVGASQVTADTWNELEELLIQADAGVETTLYLVDRLQRRAHDEAILQEGRLRQALRQELRALLPDSRPLNVEAGAPAVLLVVGVNGSGKTTSIAKLAYRCRRGGRQVLLAAGDTFRAAASDQLRLWAERAGASIVTGPEGGDPGAVVYDALQAGIARGMDVVIVDTAGRLHTQYNLMAELQKVRRVVAKTVEGGPHETLLVLDATTGQNALAQARHFQDAVEVTGVLLAKLDSTARGGVVFGISRELGLPILLLGTGEGLEDLVAFDPDAFVEGLLA